MPDKSASTELEIDGRTWIRNIVSRQDLALFDQVCDIGAVPGARIEASRTINKALGRNSFLAHQVERLLPNAKPVRIVVFNKTRDVNWQIPWHQDRVIALDRRVKMSGFTAWTRKAAVWHAEPPTNILQHMIFARVHLDEASQENGCLELALGSHSRGRIQEPDLNAVVASSCRELCEAKRGDVLFAKALIVHRSRASSLNVQRRAIRIDYCADDLPEPLDWALQLD